ncbi:hypothetical protein IWX50DRAFT_617294 [Phyllosticta citricarpa]
MSNSSVLTAVPSIRRWKESFVYQTQENKRKGVGSIRWSGQNQLVYLVERDSGHTLGLASFSSLYLDVNGHDAVVIGGEALVVIFDAMPPTHIPRFWDMWLCTPSMQPYHSRHVQHPSACRLARRDWLTRQQQQQPIRKTERSNISRSCDVRLQNSAALVPLDPLLGQASKQPTTQAAIRSIRVQRGWGLTDGQLDDGWQALVRLDGGARATSASLVLPGGRRTRQRGHGRQTRRDSAPARWVPPDQVLDDLGGGSAGVIRSAMSGREVGPLPRFEDLWSSQGIRQASQVGGVLQE